MTKAPTPTVIFGRRRLNNVYFIIIIITFITNIYFANKNVNRSVCLYYITYFRWSTPVYHLGFFKIPFLDKYEVTCYTDLILYFYVCSVVKQLLYNTQVSCLNCSMQRTVIFLLKMKLNITSISILPLNRYRMQCELTESLESYFVLYISATDELYLKIYWFWNDVIIWYL